MTELSRAQGSGLRAQGSGLRAQGSGLRAQGFTLIEVLITLAVAAILLAVAVPSMAAFIKNNRLTVATNDFVSDLIYARAEAVRRGQRVVLCASNAGGNACAPSGGNWGSGRIVFPAEAEGSIGTDSTLILRASLLDVNGNIAIAPSGFQQSLRIPFRPDGTPVLAGSTASFTVCDDRDGAFGRKIEILRTGRVLVTSGTQNCSS